MSPSPASTVAACLAARALPPLWRADRLDIAAGAGTGATARPTGFAALDAELPGGGWPASGLTELLLAAPGSGELRLLAPLLARGLGPAGSLLWVTPPFMPYAPALRALDLPLARLVIVTPESLADAAWAAEQGLRAGVCTAVLWWQATGPGVLPAPALRRLHLAALEGGCPLFAMRPAAARAQSSPAPLRLALAPVLQGQLAVTVFKRRGPAMAAPLHLLLPAAGLPLRPGGLQRVPAPSAPPAASLASETGDAVDCAAPERLAA